MNKVRPKKFKIGDWVRVTKVTMNEDIGAMGRPWRIGSVYNYPDLYLLEGYKDIAMSGDQLELYELHGCAEEIPDDV